MTNEYATHSMTTMTSAEVNPSIETELEIPIVESTSQRVFDRLARECSKLDKTEERAFADLGIACDNFENEY